MRELAVFTFVTNLLASNAQILVVPSMGRAGELGEVYDIYSHQVVNMKAFDGIFPKGTVRKQIAGAATSKLKVLHSVEDKAIAMGIGASMEVSAWLGDVGISGSIEAVTKFGLKATTTNAMLEYTHQTGNEILDIRNPALKEMYNPIIAGIVGGSHIIYGVFWGVKVIAGFYLNQVQETADKDVEAALQFQLFGSTLESSASYSNKTSISTESFYSEIYSDIALSKMHASSIPEMKALLDDIPSRLNLTSGGKGKAMSFMIIPINTLLRLYNKTNPCVRSAHKSGADNHADKLVLKNFYAHQKYLQRYENFNLYLKRQGPKLPASYLEDSLANHTSYLSHFNAFNTKMRRLLPEARNKANPAKKQETIKLYRNYTAGPHGVKSRMQDIKSVRKIASSKLADIAEYAKTGAEFVQTGTNLDHLLHRHSQSLFYVLFLKEKFRHDSDNWRDRTTTLADLPKPKYIVDCDNFLFDKICEELNGVRIYSFDRGFTKSKDVVTKFSSNNTYTALLAEERLLASLDALRKQGLLSSRRINSDTKIGNAKKQA